MDKKEAEKLTRFWHRETINIALYGMSWDGLWNKEKKLPTLRDIINRVRSLEHDYFFSEYLPKWIKEH